MLVFHYRFCVTEQSNMIAAWLLKVTLECCHFIIKDPKLSTKFFCFSDIAEAITLVLLFQH